MMGGAAAATPAAAATGTATPSTTGATPTPQPAVNYAEMMRSMYCYTHLTNDG
jgi:hypothetical protein